MGKVDRAWELDGLEGGVCMMEKSFLLVPMLICVC